MSSKCWPAPLFCCPHQHVPAAGREFSRRWASLRDSESQPPLWPLSFVLSELCSKCEDQEGRVQVPPPPLTGLVTPHPQPPPPPSPQGCPGLRFSPPQLRPLQAQVSLRCIIGLGSKIPRCLGSQGPTAQGHLSSGFWAALVTQRSWRKIRDPQGRGNVRNES